jgi:RNA polymerase sigma-70 factor (ECF subfamily)
MPVAAATRAVPARGIPTGSERPTPPDAVLAAIHGDRRGAERLLTTLLPRVRNLVRYLVRGDREIDDIAQEALVAVLRGISSFRAEGTLEAWVDRVVVRATFAFLRRRRVDAAAAPTLMGDFELVGGSTVVGPDEYLSRRRAISVLDELPVEQRHALVLHHVLEMSVPEIAAELHIPLETVRSRLRLARGRLRALGLPVADGGGANKSDGTITGEASARGETGRKK